MKRALGWQVIAFIIVRTVMNTAVRMIYPYLKMFETGLGVDQKMIAFALTARQMAGVTGPFLASVADSRGRKPGMLLGLLLLIVGTVLVVVFPGYASFVFVLILSLLGNFVFVASMQAYLGDRVQYERRGFVLGLTELGWSLSFLVAVPIMGWLISKYGWKAPFPVLGGLGILSFLFLMARLPADEVIGSSQVGLWKNFGRVFSFPPAIAGLLMGACLSASNELVNVVFGVWLKESFAIEIASLGAIAVIIGLSELSGEGLSSLLSDRLGKGRAVAFGLLVYVGFFLLLPVLGKSYFGAATGLFLIYLAFEFAVVSSMPLMTEVQPQARATLMAVYIASMSLGRALGDLLAFPLYNRGIVWIAAGGAGFALFSWLSLAWLRSRTSNL
jgi:MFS transporter, DHA1 family, inner membrane transport protein